MGLRVMQRGKYAPGIFKSNRAAVAVVADVLKVIELSNTVKIAHGRPVIGRAIGQVHRQGGVSTRVRACAASDLARVHAQCAREGVVETPHAAETGVKRDSRDRQGRLLQ